MLAVVLQQPKPTYLPIHGLPLLPPLNQFEYLIWLFPELAQTTTHRFATPDFLVDGSAKALLTMEVGQNRR